MRNTIIIFEGRTGSTHLATLLHQSPQVSFLGEEPAELKSQGWQAQKEWVCSLFDDPYNFDDSRIKKSAVVFGFRWKLRDVIDVEDYKRLLIKYNVFVIFMSRTNIVKQAVSSIRADDLAESKGYYNVRKDKDKEGLSAYEIPFQRFDKKLKWLVDHDIKLKRFMQEIQQPICHITYEQLLSNRESVLGKVSDFLDIPKFSQKDRTAKHTNDDLSKAVTNFDELVSAYQGTKYADMFSEITQVDSH